MEQPTMTKAERTTSTPKKKARHSAAAESKAIAAMTFPAMTIADPPGNKEWLARAHEELMHMRLATVMLREDDAAMTERLMGAAPDTIASMLAFATAATRWRDALTSRADMHEMVAARLTVVLERVANARPDAAGAIIEAVTQALNGSEAPA